MATGIYSWSQTAATNATADSTINWAEGQAPSTVNDSARALMAKLACWRDDLAGVKPSNAVMTTAGSANAQTLTTNLSIAALTNGWTLTFQVGADLGNTSACTLAVDSLAAKQIQYISGTNLGGGELVAGSIYTVTYHTTADVWLLHSGVTLQAFPTGTLMLFQQTAAPVGWTKQTTHNDKALRVVSGTASSGGSTAFSSIFTTLTSGGTAISQANLPVVSLSAASLTGTASGNCSITHNAYTGQPNDIQTGSGGTFHGLSSVTGASVTGTFSGSVSFGGSVPLGGSGTEHTHTVALALQYVDLIIAQKN